jgi:hypothetical protein
VLISRFAYTVSGTKDDISVCTPEIEKKRVLLQLELLLSSFCWVVIRRPILSLSCQARAQGERARLTSYLRDRSGGYKSKKVSYTRLLELCMMDKSGAHSERIETVSASSPAMSDSEKQHHDDVVGANLELDESSLPPGYFTSKFFIGSMAGIGLGLMAGVVSPKDLHLNMGYPLTPPGRVWLRSTYPRRNQRRHRTCEYPLCDLIIL